MVGTTLYLITGLPGSGKTTFAKQLAKEKNAIRFCPDDWILPLMKDRGDMKENERLRDPIEQRLWKLAQELLVKGVSVILENGFWSKDERTEYLETGKKLGARVELYFLEASLDTLWVRVEKRNMNENEFRLTRDQMNHYFTLFEPPSAEERKLYDYFLQI